jgi:hypothetical protein
MQFSLHIQIQIKAQSRSDSYSLHQLVIYCSIECFALWDLRRDLRDLETFGMCISTYDWKMEWTCFDRGIIRKFMSSGWNLFNWRCINLPIFSDVYQFRRQWNFRSAFISPRSVSACPPSSRDNESSFYWCCLFYDHSNHCLNFHS